MQYDGCKLQAARQQQQTELHTALKLLASSQRHAVLKLLASSQRHAVLKLLVSSQRHAVLCSGFNQCKQGR